MNKGTERKNEFKKPDPEPEAKPCPLVPWGEVDYSLRKGATKALKFHFPIIIIDEDFRSENASGLGIRALAKASETRAWKFWGSRVTGT